ncbi:MULTISPECIES: DUF4434 domain-containing protein [Streptosporangium]|uniref:DUF4434 domain-containing protein n=1 Tax=Streptosporangium brasiliense TaxID=47480 RepID=A0ABT9R4D2_9ACTN|nr:DUF4434 domain-containing protein [Streptosporangium brasiliense]MDP9863737.1 hypothetical protein [Streptosporangium brasiliense]
MRWLTALLGVAILAAVAAIVLVLPRDGDVPAGDRTSAAPSPSTTVSAALTPEASAFTDPCGTFDTEMASPYAVTGYWLIPTADHCTWRRQFGAIHEVGGDTVIRIGWGLQARRLDDDGRILENKSEDDEEEDKVDPRYEPCEEDGLPCVAAAERDLKAANPGNRVSWTFVYRTDEAFGPGLFRCPEFERKIQVGKTVFYRLIATEDGTDDPSCANVRNKGRGYHVILIAAAEKDSLTELLDLGDQFGVKVFPALPLAPRDPAQKTRAAQQGTKTLITLTRRILQDYGARFQDRVSLGGFYQPFELQMREMRYTGSDDPEVAKLDHPTLRVYASQHEIVEQEMPGKPILVSPYMDARKRLPISASPKQVAAGFEALARTGVGIIAPQDSRGTGKVGLFWPDQRDDQVDERLRTVVGETTNGIAYHGSTRDYYREMAAARTRMVEQGYNVQLWANVEAFEPSDEKFCADRAGTRGRTDKERLDTAVTQVGRYVSKVVSYMWSDFFTCGSPSLAEDIARDHDRPIPVDAVRKERDIQDGMEIRGYNLPMGSKVTITWDGQEAPKVVDVAGVDLTEPPPDLPARMTTAWVPFDWTQVPPGAWVRIEVAAPDGRAAAAPLHVLINA